MVSQLLELGWRLQGADDEGGFAAGQPRYNFQVPLVSRRRRAATEADVLAGHEPAVAAQHQEGRQGWGGGLDRARPATSTVTSKRSTTSTSTPPSATTSPRARSATSAPWSRRCAPRIPTGITLWLAHHEGDLVAATIAVRVGTHAWYSYGASSTEKREVRGSNAVQWAMLRDALATGATVYDLRGITDTLDPDDPHAGLIQFKVGTGGEAVEHAGEWDLPLRPLLYRGLPDRHEATAMSLTLTRRRRPLARPPAQGGRCAARSGAGGQGQRLRPRARPAGPQGRLARRRHRWRSAPTPSCPRWRAASPVTCWC